MSRFVSRLTLIVTLLLSPLTVFAQSEPRNFEITPFGGFSFGGTFDDNQSDVTAELDDAAHFGLLFNLREGSNTQWELLYSRQSTDVEISGSTVNSRLLDLDVHYLQAGGTYQGDGDTVRPYLAATIGASHFDVKANGFDSETYFSFSLGPGLQIRPNNRLGLRLEARLFGSFIQSDSSLFCVSDVGTAGCAITVDGDVLWQLQTTAGIVFRF